MAKQKSKLTEEVARQKAARLSDVTALINRNEAKMNQELNEIKQKYADKSAEIVEEAKVLSKELIEFAKSNLQFFPANRKSFTWGAVTFSHSINPPKVGIVSTMTWNDAVDRLKAAGLNEYVRTHEEVAKDLIQVMVEDEEKGNELCGQLFKLGITVTQSEKWEVKVKEEQIST